MELLCRICGRPIPIETAKSDGHGRAIHEECYVVEINWANASKDGHVSQDNVTRQWKLGTGEVSGEQNPEKFTEFVSELNQSLDEQQLDGTPTRRSDDKPESS